jgi:hypothetical protein
MALVVALGGTAIAAPNAITSALTKPKVKKIATKQANNQITRRVPGIADQRMDKRAPGIADQQIDKRAPGLSVSNANNANALGGQPASAFATRSELAQTVVGPGRVVSGSATVAASLATGNVSVMTVDGLIDLVLDCDPGQMFWEFTNRSDDAMRFSGVASKEGGTPNYETGNREPDQPFGFVGGNNGGYQVTVQATSATGRAVTMTAFIDPHGGTSCRASAQAVVTGA